MSRRRFRLKPAGYAVLGILILLIVLCVYAIARAVSGANRHGSQEVNLPSSSPSTSPELVTATYTPAPPETPTPTMNPITVTPSNPPVTYSAPPTQSPTAKPQATPRVPTSSEKRNAQAGVLQNDGVNLRSGPSTSYERIGTYDKGDTMQVYDTDGDFYFVKMDKDDKVGFMSKKFVTVGVQATIPADVPTDAVPGKVTANVVALRSGPNKTDTAITELKKDEVLFVYYQVGEFYYVEVAATGKKGFAYASYVKPEGSVPVK